LWVSGARASRRVVLVVYCLWHYNPLRVKELQLQLQLQLFIYIQGSVLKHLRVWHSSPSNKS